MVEFPPSATDLSELPDLFPDLDETDESGEDRPFIGTPVTPPGFARMVNSQRNFGLVW